MRTKQTLTSLVALGSLAVLVGCGGSAPGGYAKSGYDAPSQPGDSAGDASDDSGSPGPSYAPNLSAQPVSPSAPPPAGDFGGGASRGRAAEKSSRSESAPRDGREPFELTPEQQRPGLATQWGESRFSRVTTAPFVRADLTQPFAVEKLFYNDPDGIAAMSDTHGGNRVHMRRFAIGGGHLEVGLRDGSGRFLTGFAANGNNFVTGTNSQRYSIFIKNHSPGRIEAVVSVDGLDVIDGKSASLNKRGYLIDPFGDLEIEGFRTSTNEVASFRFGSVRDSYANQKHGDTRNVGVIGLAMFHERGDNPRFWGSARSHDDVVDRNAADPFPNRFAAPPN